MKSTDWPKFSRDEELPAYYQMKEYLKELIQNGRLQPGEKILSERDLALRADMSRMTVRQALSELVQEGLLTRAGGSGTFVSRPKFVYKLQSAESFTEYIESRGLSPETKVLRQRLEPSAEAGVCESLGLSAGAALLCFERLRRLAGETLLFERVYLDGIRFRSFLSEDLEKQSLYRLLAERCEIRLAGVHQTAEPSVADDYLAGIMEVSRGLPLLKVNAVAYDAAKAPIEYSIAYYRGDKYKFIISE